MKYYHRYQVAPSKCEYPPPPSQTVTGTPVLAGCRDVQLGLTVIGHVISLLGPRPKQLLTQNRSRAARQNKFNLANSRPLLVAYCTLRTAPVPIASLSDALLIPSSSLGVTLSSWDQVPKTRDQLGTVNLYHTVRPIADQWQR